MNYVRVFFATALVLAAAANLEAATAAWNRNPESTVTGYRLSYGTQPGVHPTTINVGNVLSYQFFPPAGVRYYVVVQAYNASGTLSPKSAEAILDLTVSQPPPPPPPSQNQPPVLTQPANQSSVRSTAVSLTLIASDPQGTAVSFSTSGLPPGLTINASTGVISGTVSTVGTYNVTATASDGSLSATRTFSWTVTSSSSAQTTVVLSPTDTSIDVFGANYVNHPRLYAYTYPANRVGQAILMKFDLSQIPASAVIQSATLELSLVEADPNTTDPSYSMSLHQVINRNPDLARATGATAGTASWTANTCCYQNVPMAQSDISPARAVTVVNRTLGVKTWNALTLVQAWRSAPATNYGLLLNADTTKGSDRFRVFGSMQNEAATSRPALRIVYSSGSTASTSMQTMSVSSAVAGGTTTTSSARTAGVNNTPTTLAAAATQPAADAGVESLAASTPADAPLEDGEIAVAGDFDGDGRPDPATYHRATGEWRIRLSSTNFNVTAPIVWGVSSDVPVPADYDGDRRTDIAVYRPSTGTWHVLLSSTNMQSRLELQWGDASDSPLPIDHDRDGRADLALPRAGGFEILLSGSNYRTSVTVR